MLTLKRKPKGRPKLPAPRVWRLVLSHCATIGVGVTVRAYPPFCPEWVFGAWAFSQDPAVAWALDQICQREGLPYGTWVDYQTEWQ